MSEASPDPLETSKQSSLFLDQHPLFNYVAECQAMLDIRNFEEKEIALQEGQKYIDDLDRMVKEAGLWGRPVTLKGPKLSITYKLPNEQGTALENLSVCIDSANQNPECRVQPEGVFQGFDHGYSKLEIDGKEFYQLQLGYFVLLEGSATRDVFDPYYAWGACRNTKIEFQADKQRVDVFTSVANFVEDGDPTKEKLVADLAEFITAETVSGIQLATAAVTINTYLETSHKRLSKDAKTALLDLIRAKLQLYGPRQYAVNVSPSCLEPDDATNEHAVVPGIVGHAIINDIVYGPVCTVDTTGKWFAVKERPHALYASSEVAGDTTASRSLLLPLNAIRTIKPRL